MTLVSVLEDGDCAQDPARVAGVSTPPPVADEDGESPDLPEQMRIRRQKYDRLHDTLYPVKVARTHSLAEIRAAYPDLAPD